MKILYSILVLLLSVSCSRAEAQSKLLSELGDVELRAHVIFGQYLRKVCTQVLPENKFNIEKEYREANMQAFESLYPLQYNELLRVWDGDLSHKLSREELKGISAQCQTQYPDTIKFIKNNHPEILTRLKKKRERTLQKLNGK